MDKNKRLLMVALIAAALCASAIAGFVTLYSLRHGASPQTEAFITAGLVSFSCVVFLAVSRFFMARVQEGQARLTAIVETAADGIVTTDEDGVIESLNTAAERIFGYRAGEVLGNSMTMLLPSAYSDDDDVDFRQFLRMNDIKVTGRAQEGSGLRRNGVVFPMDMSLSSTKVNGRLMYTMIVRDITERKQAQEALRRARDELELRVEERTADLRLTNEHLQAEVRERERIQAERERLIGELQEALASVKTLRGLIPICASCKKIRDDQGFWSQVEDYVGKHSEAEFSHGICPECARKLYPDIEL